MLEMYLALVDTPEEKSKFEELYNTYKQDMYAIAYAILNNVQDAEDAVSQAFFSIAESFTKISQTPCHELRSYVVIITKNTALNIYRKNKAERTHSVPVEYDLSKYLEEYPDDNYQYLVESIRSLTGDDKDIIVLYYLYGFTAKQIGKQLSISEDAVRKRVERAKIKLKERLELGDNYDP